MYMVFTPCVYEKKTLTCIVGKQVCNMLEELNDFQNKYILKCVHYLQKGLPVPLPVFNFSLDGATANEEDRNGHCMANLPNGAG